MSGASTALYGVLGSPVGHSLSPAMMNAAFAACAIDAQYLAFEVAPSELADAVLGLRALHAWGLNVTLPHKEMIVPLLDELADSARDAGAVNTVVRDGGRLVGHNTDASGFVRALLEADVDPRGGHAVVLGSGGAARAVAAGLARAGVTSITVAARNEARARELTTFLAARHPGVTLQAAPLVGASGLSPQTTIVAHCTPAGMVGGPDGEALANGLPLHTLSPQALVVDLVYRPRETPLLRAAAARGLGTLSGLTMLLHQGAAAFELWIGRAPPVEVMRRALESALHGGGDAVP